jgi:hypothetical protein
MNHASTGEIYGNLFTTQNYFNDKRKIDKNVIVILIFWLRPKHPTFSIK